MKNLLKKLAMGLLLFGMFAHAQGVQIFTSANDDGKITPASIEAAFKKVGFYISTNRDMNVPFTKQFKETTFDVYNLVTFYSKADTLELVKRYPQIGLFSPMSMSVYTKKGEKTISISTLTVEAMAEVLGVPADDKTLVKIGEMVKEALKAAMPQGKFEEVSYKAKKPEGDRVTHFSMEVDEDEWEDVKDEFDISFEGELATNGFIKAGFNNLGDDFEEAGYEGFGFYEVYSICKLPVIYSVAKTRPEAGAFAPCSLYFYKKKGEDKMQVAFPSVYNWISELAIDDKAALDELKDAQERMEKILSTLME